VPKQIYKIDKFHGGLNTNADPRDIAENELSEAQDVMVDELGRIRMMGGVPAHGRTNAFGSSTINPGYGLFQFSHDRVDGHTIGSGTEIGADYLVFSDADTTGYVLLYSDEDDQTGSPIRGLTDNTSGLRKDVFYSVDGALRVCDADFGNTNSSKWYGYIDREFMYNSGSTVSVDTWSLQSQYISRPGANSGWDDDIRESTTTAGASYESTATGIGSALASAGTMYYYENGNDLRGKAENIVNIYVMTITIRVNYDGVDDSMWAYEITAGDATNSTTPAGSLGINHKSTSYVGDGSVEDTSVIEDTVHTLTFAVADTPIGADGTTGAIVKLVVGTMGGDVNSIDIHKVIITKGTASGVGEHVGVDGNDIDTNEVFIDAAFETTTDAIGWDRKWEHGFSFIYDEKQESLVRRIEKVDVSSGATTPATYIQPVTDAAHAPSVRISIPYASDWNPRITGGVWYIRDASGTVPSKWWGQIECNFVQGTGKILSSGQEFDCEFNPDTDEYNFNVDHENLLQPNQTDTYFSRTGVQEDEESIISRFSTAVVVGRRTYVGNVQITKNDGSKEIKADAMIKSPVNSFDIFPSKGLVEASINDGESIVKLEEFADRILQFKQRTLYIINVSQDIEFLEDVYKHKGVAHPGAVCKTDYGIAWVNKFGCYLYDGKQVINLLEKGGRQMIKDASTGDSDSWEDFITESATSNSIIGYIPKKRQLIVVKDVDGTSNGGDIFLYDMVTQSWVQGYDKVRPGADTHKTNIVADWNGDAVIAMGTAGAVHVWDDDPDGSVFLRIKTKDIDFGFPGVRKKIYKVLVSYKGDADQVKVEYGVNGETDIGDLKQFNSDDTPLLDKSSAENLESWHTAELKPTTSSEANNIYSIRLWFTTTAGAGFAINDISVVYRMKSIK